jgi:hypothetical protein
LEVERIATSWWKLKRAWRYENAELICAQSDVELALEAAQDKEMTPGNRACIALLRSAQAEIRDTGGISDELREKMFGTYHGLRELFGERVGIAKGLIVKYSGLPPSEAEKLGPAANLLLATDLLIMSLEGRMSREYVARVAKDRLEIPHPEALDRVLRADTAAERNLSRAIDRLESLQRRRQGEAVPPPVNVRLSQ